MNVYTLNFSNKKNNFSFRNTIFREQQLQQQQDSPPQQQQQLWIWIRTKIFTKILCHTATAATATTRTESACARATSSLSKKLLRVQTTEVTAETIAAPDIGVRRRRRFSRRKSCTSTSRPLGP
jgi:hypothetical protein